MSSRKSSQTTCMSCVCGLSYLLINAVGENRPSSQQGASLSPISTRALLVGKPSLCCSHSCFYVHHHDYYFCQTTCSITFNVADRKNNTTVGNPKMESCTRNLTPPFGVSTSHLTSTYYVHFYSGRLAPLFLFIYILSINNLIFLIISIRIRASVGILALPLSMF